MMTKIDTRALIKELGGPYALARAMNAVKDADPITPQAISQWKRVPVGRCLQLEHATNGRKRCHELRPDVFPAPSTEAA